MINKLLKVKSYLQGKKTYIVMSITILSSLLSYLNGDISINDCIQAVLTACGLGTIRAGVASNANTLRAK